MFTAAHEQTIRSHIGPLPYVQTVGRGNITKRADIDLIFNTNIPVFSLNDRVLADEDAVPEFNPPIAHPLGVQKDPIIEDDVVANGDFVGGNRSSCFGRRPPSYPPS